MVTHSLQELAMKRSLLSGLWLCLFVYGTVLPGLAQADPDSGRDLLMELRRDGWTAVQDGVLRRELRTNEVETFVFGEAGFSWKLRDLRAQLQVLRREFQAYPTPKLRRAIASHRKMIASTLKMIERARAAEAGGETFVFKSGCAPTFAYNANASYKTDRQGTWAAASADFNVSSGCSSSGEVYAYAFAKVTVGGAPSTATVTDGPRSGSNVNASADANRNGGAPCESYAYASVTSDSLSPTSYSISQTNNQCPVPVPTIAITDSTVGEGGTADALFTVTLSNPYDQQVAVSYATADGTALATTDYVATSGTLIFAAGQTSQTITVLLRRDDLPELTERFFVNLSAPVNATLADAQGVGTITDDDTSYHIASGADSPANPGCFTMADTYFEKSAVYATKPFSLANKLDMTFKVFFGQYDAGGGGLVWLLSQGYALGDDDMGYGSIFRSVGVEMDTTANYTLDPEEDHVAVDYNGATCCHQGNPPVQASATSTNIEDNAQHELRVKRDPVAQRLDVYFDGSPRFATVDNLTSNIFGGNPNVYWGFTGANNCASIPCPNSVLYWCPVAVCIGDTATQHVLVEDIDVSERSPGPVAAFKVRLFCPRSQTVTLSYTTANGTATAGADYIATSGTLTFAPGETEKTVSVTLVRDAVPEATETFYLNLSSPSSNLAVPDTQAAARIVD
jgi:hypothetical protein